MLLIQTKVKKSDIAGLGLFAEEDIPKGTIVWKFQPPFDIIVDLKKFSQLPAAMQSHIRHYGYRNKKYGHYVVFADNAGFFNHSETPNIIGHTSLVDNEGINIAARDIVTGEELLVNYWEYDAEAQEKLSGSV